MQGGKHRHSQRELHLPCTNRSAAIQQSTSAGQELTKIANVMSHHVFVRCSMWGTHSLSLLGSSRIAQCRYRVIRSCLLWRSLMMKMHSVDCRPNGKAISCRCGRIRGSVGVQSVACGAPLPLCIGSFHVYCCSVYQSVQGRNAISQIAHSSARSEIKTETKGDHILAYHWAGARTTMVVCPLPSCFCDKRPHGCTSPGAEISTMIDNERQRFDTPLPFAKLLHSHLSSCSPSHCMNLDVRGL